MSAVISNAQAVYSRNRPWTSRISDAVPTWEMVTIDASQRWLVAARGIPEHGPTLHGWDATCCGHPRSPPGSATPSRSTGETFLPVRCLNGCDLAALHRSPRVGAPASREQAHRARPAIPIPTSGRSSP